MNFYTAKCKKAGDFAPASNSTSLYSSLFCFAALLCFLNDSCFEVCGQQLIPLELEGEPASALGGGTKHRREIIHLAHRNLSFDHLQTIIRRVHPQHTTAALVQLADNIASIAVRNIDL